MKIVIASGKGGTGKTTLSVNLAYFTSGFKNVVLCDLDVEEPNSCLFFKNNEVLKRNIYRPVPVWNEEKCRKCGHCQEICNFNAVIKIGDKVNVIPTLCHSCYACSELCPVGALPMGDEKLGEVRLYGEGALQVVDSRLEIGQEQASPMIAKAKDFAASLGSVDCLYLFDAPPGTACPTIEATKDADLVILVTEPTPFGLNDLKLAVETMEQMSLNYGVVINRYGIGDSKTENFCVKNGIDVIAKIPDSRRVAELYSAGKLVVNELIDFREKMEQVYSYITTFNKNGQ